MSHAYYVHKEDADEYDLRRKELDTIIKERDAAESNINYEESDWQQRREAIYDLYCPKMEAICNKYKEPRVISLTDKNYPPSNRQDYFVYYRGGRLDDDFGNKLAGVAKTGLTSIKKLLGVQK